MPSFPFGTRHPEPEPLRIAVSEHGRSVVVEPVGRLDDSTYGQLRDVLLKQAAEHPDLVVVDLDGLGVRSAPALAVFPAVAAALGTWPGIALRLVARGPRAAELRAHGITKFVRTFPTAEDALADAGAPPIRPRLLLPLQGATGARAARRWVRARLHDWTEAFPDFVDAAVQVASELVENAVCHTGSPDALRLERHPRGLSIAVSDGECRAPVAVAAGDATTSGGRGLTMVAEIAQAWGHRLRAGGGKVVWAVLSVPGGVGAVLR